MYSYIQIVVYILYIDYEPKTCRWHRYFQLTTDAIQEMFTKIKEESSKAWLQINVKKPET